MKATLGRWHITTMQGLMLLLVFVWLITGGAQAAESPVKLAIIIEAAEFARVADLLTVELSAQPQVQVLERAQIEKLYREQQLSVANGDYVKLGHLLGADGLLLLGKVAEGTNNFIGVRLVAVKPGVVTTAVRSTWPVDDQVAWAGWLIRHFGPFLPKLSVPVTKAIPISVVNLRSAVKSAAAEELERQLTILSIERLTRERELFVLERRRMDRLSNEKELAGMGESEFWNGSYLLEGTIDRDGYSAKTVTVHARLLPPRGGVAVDIVVSGPRASLAEVTGQLVEQLMAALQKSPSGGSWRANEEAAKYFEEAKWAMKWRMTAEAQAATESAWALGRRTPEVAQSLVRAYVESMPDGSVNGDDGMHVLQVPDASAFPRLERGLDFVLQNASVFFGSTNSVESFTLGMRLLRQAFNQLESYYYAAEMRPQHLDDLLSLRSNARRMLKMLDGQGAAITNVVKWSDPRLTYVKLRWREAGVAFEHPEDALGFYRELLFAGAKENDLPRIIGWTWADRRHVPAMMRQLVDEARASTSAAVRLEGLFLALLLAPDDEQGSLRRAEEELESAIWENREILFRDADRATLVERTRVALTKKTREEDIYKPFVHEPFSSFKHRLRMAFLADPNATNVSVLEEFFPNTSVKMETPEQARQLLPLMEALFQTPALAKRSNYKLAALRQSTGIAGQPPAPAPLLEAARVLEARFVPWKLALDRSDSDRTAQFAGMIYRNGHLWMRARYFDRQQGEYSRDCSTRYLSVDLQRGVTGEIPVPDQHQNAGGLLEVSGNSLFVDSGGFLYEYKFGERTWTRIPVPMEGATSFVWRNGRLFVGRADGLLAVNPETAQAQVLVSSRRTPPANEIDPLWTPDTKIFPLADGQLGALVAGDYLKFDPAAERWSILPLPLKEKKAVYNMTADYFSPEGPQRLLTGFHPRRYLIGFWNEAPAESLLMEETGIRNAPPAAEKLLPPLRWDWPKNYPMEHSQIVAEGKTLWALAPRRLGMGSPAPEPVKFSDARDATLLCFTPDRREPLSVAVRFPTNALPNLPIINGRPTDILEPSNFGFMMMFQRFQQHVGNMAFWFRVPGGLVFGGPKYAGHWFIADAEVEKTFAPQRELGRGSTIQPASPASNPQSP
jgi:hypothetical protein